MKGELFGFSFCGVVTIPNYDVECSSCGFSDIEMIKLSELTAWDTSALCPQCAGASGVFRRVINHAPASRGGAKAADRLEVSRKASVQQKFVGSGEKDDMRHRHSKHCSHQVANAIESVKKGEFEGF